MEGLEGRLEEQYKLEREAWKREHPGAKGGPEIQLLRCEPQDYSADAAIIGPNGRHPARGSTTSW